MRELSLDELEVIAGGWQSKGATTSDMGSPHEGRRNNSGGGNGGNNRGLNTHEQWAVMSNSAFAVLGKQYESCTSGVLGAIGSRGGSGGYQSGSSHTNRNNGNH
ncbi:MULTISPECIES: hypothetical protein [Aeromonas]|uniref:hypothetical protein n=1 Tax=Aeromonas TaxID=642 RepID=UPI00244428A0|nr:hypothetical protein [Aeromonas dhakensis]